MEPQEFESIQNQIRELKEIMQLPHIVQPEKFVELAQKYTQEAPKIEESEFKLGLVSFFDAFTQTSFLQNVYQKNSETIRQKISTIENWRIVEIGGGNGALYQKLLTESDVGEIVLIDPVPQVHERVRQILPPGVILTSIIEHAENATIPDCDVLVMSLVLHHIPGIDVSKRTQYGFEATKGKLEVLQMCYASLVARNGICIVNENDLDTELDLEPNSMVLRNNFFDASIRRLAMGMCDEILSRADQVSLALIRQWKLLLGEWGVKFMRNADREVTHRHVYGLSVARWLQLFNRSGFFVESYRFTDNYCYLVQFVLKTQAA